MTIITGAIQTSGGGGAGSTSVNIVGSTGFAPVTSSFGLLVQSTQPVTISGTPTILSASSGLVQISGTPLILSASSGFVQISGTSPIVSASSGFVQIVGSTAVGPATVAAVTSSGALTAQVVFPITQSVDWTTGSTPQFLTLTTSSGLPTLVTTVLNRLVGMIPFSTGVSGFVQFYNQIPTLVVLGSGILFVSPIAVYSTTNILNYDLYNSPRGMIFGTACSAAAVASPASTSLLSGTAYLSVEMM